ncbi:MAG TPA: sensor domain-containing diguanylate cyclase [Solirubrobacteraceae bacterium]|nr:sensor domain-containing diguanylate cyclase [Solirubrobacteraceae bacterium]
MAAENVTAELWASTLDALMDAASAVLTAESLDQTLRRVAHGLGRLVPFHDLTLYEIDRAARLFVPMFAFGSYSAEVMAQRFPLERGITGATLREGRVRNVPRSDRDPHAETIPGTPEEPEAIVCVPLKVGGRTIAMLNVYRYGQDPAFSDFEALIIERFGIIVALALDSARQQDLLRTQADTDELTGLLNRRAFNQRMTALLQRARLQSTPLTLIEIDVDGFKLINDRFGHAAGDSALIAVAESLLGSVREGECVARIGGEEFAILLPAVDHDIGLMVADRCRRRPTPAWYTGSPLTLSAGVATYPLHGTDAEELLHAADKALYLAKSAGRNRVVVAADPVA